MLSDERKTELWEHLLGSEDYVIGDEKSQSWMQRKNLCLEDVYGFGMQDRKVRLRGNVATGQPTNSAPAPGKISLPPAAPPTLVGPDIELSKLEPSPLEPSAEAKSTPRIRKPVRQFEPSERTSKEAPGNNLKYLSQAKFTPYKDLVREEDDIQRQAGVARVYIDPYTDEDPKDGKRTGTKSKKRKLIALFKSEQLKDPEWLTSRARVWETPEVIRADEGTPPQKKGGPWKKVSPTAAVETPIINDGRVSPVAPDQADVSGLKPPSNQTAPSKEASASDVSKTSTLPPQSLSNHEQSSRDEIRINISRTTEAQQHPDQMSAPNMFPPPAPQMSSTHTPSSSFMIPTPPQTVGLQTPSDSYAMPTPPQSMHHSTPYHQPPYQSAYTPQFASPYVMNNGPIKPVVATPSYSSPYSSPYAQAPADGQPQKKKRNRKRKATDNMGAAPKRVQVEAGLPQTQSSLSSAVSAGSVDLVPELTQAPHLTLEAVPTTSSQVPNRVSGTVAKQVQPQTNVPLDKTSPFFTVPPVTSQLPDPITPQPPIQIRDEAVVPPVKFPLSSTPLTDLPNISNQITPQVPNQVQNEVTGPPKHTFVSITNPIEPPRLLDPIGHQAVLNRQKERERKENEFQAVLEEANSIEIPNFAARFSAKYQDDIGNVVLSDDHSNLKLLGVQQSLSDLPLLVIPISSITEYPILSSKGSNPMELFVYVRDDEGHSITYRFNFGRDSKAFGKANDMRAKLCQAWITHIKSRGDGESSNTMLTKELKEALPFFCPNEGCGKRWKNREGIIYHYAKSNTPCNKNWVAPTAEQLIANPPKKRGRRKKQRVSLKSDSPAVEEDNDLSNDLDMETTENLDTMDKEFIPEPNETGLELDNVDYDLTSSDDSLQSIIDYALKASAPKPSTTSKRRRQSSVVANTEALQAVVDEAALIEAPEEPLTDTIAWPSTTRLSENTDVRQLTKEIILGLVKENNGVFPGDRSLWYATFATYLKKAAQSRLLITAEVCSGSLITLLGEGKLKSTSMSFVDNNSETVNRTIIMEPSVDTKSLGVEKLQKTIQDLHPEYYVPSQFAPEEKLLTVLRGAARMEAPEPRTQQPTRKRRKRNLQLIPNSRAASAYSIEDGHGFDNNEELGELDIGGSDVDDTYEMVAAMGTESSKPKARRTLPSTRSRDQSVPGTVPESQPRDPRRVRVPFTAEQKERRAIKVARTLQSWNQPAPYIQSTETSAWSQIPEQVKPQRAPRILQRRQIPEPITYMQAPDGAWSIRPFGHGVRPIYSRPSRQAVGNPMLDIYLKRRDNGFRPVIVPEGKRMFLPRLPSKYILEDPSKRSRKPKSQQLDDTRDSTPDALTGADDSPMADSPSILESYDLVSTVEDDPDFVPRVSTATGKPVRPYNRKVRTWKSGSVMSVEYNTPVPSERPRRTRRSSVYAVAKESSSLAIGAQLEERKANPGLESLPPGFGLEVAGTPNANLLADEFEKRISLDVESVLQDRVNHRTKFVPTQSVPLLVDLEQTADWERGIAQGCFVGGTVAPNSGWINHTVTRFECPLETKTTLLSWQDDNAFTMNTLPYEKVDDADVSEYMDDLVDVPLKPRYRFSENDIHPASLQARRNRERQAQYKTRPLTVLESAFKDVADDSIAAAKELGLQVVPISAVAPARKKIKGISRADENRLIVAVVVIRVVTGGFDMTIDWALVSMVLTEFTDTFLSKRWNVLLQKQKDLITKLTKNFQDVFLPAYESGEIPPIDYDNLPAYKWGALVNWTMNKLSSMFEIQVFDLPDSRKTLSKEYICTEKEISTKGREDYFSRPPTVAERINSIAFFPAAVPIVPQPKPAPADEIKIDDFQIAKSLVRATALTPEAAWDKDVAMEKLSSVTPTHLEEAIAALRKDKVIVKRRGSSITPGRQYEISVGYMKTEIVMVVRDQQVTQAVEFKRFLDEEFASGKECVRSEYMANEGSMLCVSQLQAHGRIRLQGVNIPNNKFGFTSNDNYVTKQIPPKTWIFQVDINPTDSYIYDSDIDVLKYLAFAEPPRGGPSGEIPVWYGITDEVIPAIWGKVAVALSGTIALRTGSTIASLKLALKTALEQWEIQRFVEWGERIGLFERLHDDIEGWAATEWWWAIAGRCCEKE